MAGLDLFDVGYRKGCFDAFNSLINDL